MLKRDVRPVVYLQNGQLLAAFLPSLVFVTGLMCLRFNRSLGVPFVIWLKIALLSFAVFYLVQQRVHRYWRIPFGVRIGVTFGQGCGVVGLAVLTVFLMSFTAPMFR